MARPLLEICDLNIDFRTEEGNFHALKNVGFRVERGGITAVVGESGSGKSVTALSILKLLSPSASYRSGNIFFSDNGETATDLLGYNFQMMKKIRGNRISMIFQEPMTSLNPLMRCGAQVKEAILLHQKMTDHEAEEKTMALFRKVQLPDPQGMMKRYPHQLSGGQKQRVMIALAISCEPALLIADEPTTALDVTVQMTILGLIKDLQVEKNMGVIFISHDLGLVSDIADHIVVMYKGQVVEQGPTNVILHQPSHPYTKALLACRPVLHPKGQRLPMVSDFMDIGEEALPHQTDPGESVRIASADQITTISHKHDAHDNLIEVSDLRIWFPSKTSFLGKPLAYVKAVDGVSFEIRQGETLGLVGESGCGKTTLGRALLRLVDPSSGKIIFKDKELTAMSRDDLKPFRKEIQIIFQDPYSSLNPRLSVGNAIGEVMQVHQIGHNATDRKYRVVQWLEKVGLKADHYGRYPHEFSGGQRQRIGIARALALNPDFVVCDESVSALDVSVQAQVLNLLNDLKEEMGFTTLFISHDLAVVHYISDRIMVMNQGKIEESGEAGQIFHHPRKAYTQKLLEAIPGRIF